MYNNRDNAILQNNEKKMYSRANMIIAQNLFSSLPENTNMLS